MINPLYIAWFVLMDLAPKGDGLRHFVDRDDKLNKH